MDRIEILTRLGLILRRLERLADLETTSREDRSQAEEEITWLREKWQELTHELDRKRGHTDESAVPSENSGHARWPKRSTTNAVHWKGTSRQ